MDLKEDNKLVESYNTSLVFISNLPYEVSREEIQELFDAHDIKIVRCEIIRKGKKERLQPSGLAVVMLEEESAIQISCSKLNGIDFCGRVIAINSDKFT